MMFFNVGASAYCIDKWACFSIERDDDKVEVYLINKKPYVITSTISIDTQNLASKDSYENTYEQTRVLQGLERKRVLLLSARDSQRRTRYSLNAFNWTPGNMNAQHDDSHVYLKPYAAGEYFRVVQGYGGGWSHRGASKYALDFDMPEGTPVHAARGGTVIDLTERHWRGGASRRYARYANFVTILHSDDTTGEYYHLRQNGVVVEVGQEVKAGDLIGYSGNTGFSSMPHLHFAVYRAKSRGNFESLPVKFDEPIRLPWWQRKSR
ncbi:M23 family metallopeptidase [Aliiglaciecola sp. M165]|uniref:M23 family metallopeptidase n=1 Tax=Aliiglaciecola sp. M165 TaxID=2593649 RepID=UPI00117D3EB3|nr:M23 family metallopeptidase [Aliiglaciecola sp. M165]TRY31535.1 M23 family metallopeptidase [Aliiglaciecola sp. M165]